MSISEDVYKTLNASKQATKVPLEAGGGYMAVFEGIHLIHCVVLLSNFINRIFHSLLVLRKHYGKPPTLHTTPKGTPCPCPIHTTGTPT
jgi:hypothetical protein